MGILDNLNISQKINTSFYLSFFIVAILLVIPFIKLIQTNQTYQKQLKTYALTQEYIYNINDSLKKISSNSIEESLKNKSLDDVYLEYNYENMIKSLNMLKKNILIKNNDKLKKIISNIQNRIIGYKEIAKSLKDEMESDIEDGVYAILALTQASSKISYELNILLDKVKEENQKQINEIKENISKTIKIYIAVSFLTLVVLMYINKKIAKKIIYDLNKLKQLIDSFFEVLNKKRDKALHIKIETNDEIGNIAKVVDKNIYIAEDLIKSERERAKEIEVEVDKATKEIRKLNKELHLTQKEIIQVMGGIAEEHSKETGLHIQRVASYSFILAKLAGLSLKEAILLRDVSPMHDIGKLGIPDEILKKPGKFNDKEYEIIKKHPEIGYNMLKNSKRELLKAAAIVAYEHHERWDGKGYPRGIKGEEIHIYGRITAIADVFDALASDRVYKKAWPLEKIIKLFKEEKGKQFDPKLTQLFLDNLNDFLDSKTSIEARSNF
jgi:response regulator RpfG family c-di-GMP phosphodiesterase